MKRRSKGKSNKPHSKRASSQTADAQTSGIGSYLNGIAQANAYYKKRDEHALLDAFKAAHAEGPETLRGFSELLAMLMHEPVTGAETVQQQLASASELVMQAGFVLNNIQHVCNDAGNDNPLFYVIGDAAKHGNRLTDDAQKIVDAIREHRAEVAE